MSASARNYAFIVKVKEPEKPESELTKERLEECKKMVEPYLKKNDGKKS